MSRVSSSAAVASDAAGSSSIAPSWWPIQRARVPVRESTEIPASRPTWMVRRIESGVLGGVRLAGRPRPPGGI